ncbi:MAG: nitrite reductase large subunit NirB [Candidatus Dormibacteria bacterium]
MLSTTRQTRVAVVGNGMVAATLLEELAARGGDRFAITVFGDEPHPAYDRIKLSSVLAGTCEADQLTLLDRSWYRRNGVMLLEGRRVVSIDRDRREVSDDSGDATEYDVCILATGSDAVIPAIEGKDRGGVHAFRTLRDVDAILSAAGCAQSAVVLGGGLLGLEAAYGLQARGLPVTVVHLMDRLMERQLDGAGARLLHEQLERLGMRMRLSAETVALHGNGTVEAVALSDGSIIDADLVVVACGVRPRVELATYAGLEVRRGIVIDDQMRTSDPSIYAVGECAEHRGRCYGIVAPLREQARALAAHLTGTDGAAYRGGVEATTLKVAGVNVFSAGRFDANPEDEVLTLHDTGTGVYKKVVINGGRVEGAVLVGDLATAPRITAALGGLLTVGGARLALVAPPTGEPASSVADALADDAVVCGCNGVTKAAICTAIMEKGCASRREVTACTRAAGSCGSCGTLVDALVATHAGASSSSPPEPTFCTCLPFPRRELRAAIVERDLRSVQVVLDTLGDGAGCARCKPALAYLLDVVWCGDYQEDRSARFINDRVHANIQKDATFSVVPRMFGGVTTASELRRIADVAERFEVRMIKVTGGQRLDLLGVRKEDLPAIWQALDIPSGHAYAKAVRTVKTCVGTEFCRFGIGDSTALGIELERALWGLYTPHKLKSGVTGCPRNCAEITVKDLGIMAIATGWEIYVGGAAGMTVRKGDLLSTVATAEDAMLHALLFVQHYREEAEYLERAYHYVARVGIAAVRTATVDADVAAQQALLARFKRARANVRDPWATEGAEPRTPWQFSALPAPAEAVPCST